MARARGAVEQSAEAEVSRSVIALHLSEPFFAHILHGLSRRMCDATPTAAVALVQAKIELRVNPQFFLSLTKDERVAVIKHEVLHVVLKHLLRSRGRVPLLWNLACDVVVNALVGKWRLPKGAVTRATFPDLPIPEDATADQVYSLLAGLERELRACGGNGAATSAPKSAEALERLSGESSSQSVGGHSDHAAWGKRQGEGDDAEDSAASGEAEELAASAAVDGMLVSAADRDVQAWDTLPQLLRRAVEEARARGQAKLDWRRVLRLFASGLGRTRLVTTTRRESARYGRNHLPGQGIDPRAPSSARLVPGVKIRRLNSLLVAVDTSGSISTEIVSAFFKEINAIWRSGASVVVLPCDAEVGEPLLYDGHAPKTLQGGGGTLFEPVFAWMISQTKYRFDGLIYLTDGMGPSPTTRPRCKVLWVVTDRAWMGPHLCFGRRIALDLA